ncbi:DUF5668 domain-containing protein [Desulfosporosinus sp. BG]|uniref:LiaI-LiaF-like domain-containing protein n=1 Tax=Desulfosporosinus sp. BG TaxID=1633135 RepID=UPI00083A1CD5|nr:DUF5668 domain-containing protein [Desulfosporosinus sp. BG]ODA39038.1 hypothetical protein DSBG_4177 [Desulfosporosinus sp. BG]
MRRAFDSISRGLLLITIGVIFFLLNYGILSWSFWFHVVELWPLVLILAGIGLLFSRKIPFSAVLLVFILSIAGYSLAVGDKPIPWQVNIPFMSGTTVTKSLNVPLPAEVKKAQVNLKLGGSQVQVQALDPGNSEHVLMNGNYQGKSESSTPEPNGSELSSQQLGDTLAVTLSTASFGGNTNKSNRSGLALNLSTKAHNDLDITAGAINGTIDLRRLPVEDLKISTGASNFELQFGDTEIATQGKIDSGASKLTLVVPENVGLRIGLNGVATNTNFMGSGLLLEDKNWVSPNYTEAKTKIDLEISTAAGTIQLDRPKINMQ